MVGEREERQVRKRYEGVKKCNGTRLSFSGAVFALQGGLGQPTHDTHVGEDFVYTLHSHSSLSRNQLICPGLNKR